MKYLTGFGKANGTFGELLQGVLPNGKKFMVTFPINIFSYVKFIPEVNNNAVNVFPAHKIKSKTIAEKLICNFNLKIGGNLIINSEIPEGKGLASSSADLVATAYAIADSLKTSISEQMIAELILEIEPSDGIMYSGIVSFYHQELKLINTIGNLSSLIIIAVDEGYTVDTIDYNARTKIYTSADAAKYNNMLNKMSYAIRKHDLGMIGKITTESAIMNQQNNPKKYLDEFIHISNEVQALGIVVAHSGSFIGVLLDPQPSNFYMQKEFCINKLKKLNQDIKIFSSIDFNIVNALESTSNEAIAC
jgi:L-threonine kinase